MIRWCAALLTAASLAQAQIELPDVDAPAEGDLVSEHKSVAPGGTLWVGVRITMKPTWHVYWRNPGDSGLPVTVVWTLPQGVKASLLRWPAPHRIPTDPLMMYGYDDEVLLAAEIAVPKDWKGKTIKIAARASWLVCADVCLEGSMSKAIEVAVKAGAGRDPTQWAEAFARARAALPVAAPQGALEAGPSVLRIDLKKLPISSKARVHFFPRKAGWLDHAAAQTLTRSGGQAVLSLPLMETDSNKMKNRNVEGVLVITEGKARRAFAVDLPVVVPKK